MPIRTGSDLLCEIFHHIGRNCVSLIVSGMIKPETNGICYSAPHKLVHYRPLDTTANSAKEVSALGEAAGPSPLMLSVANAIKFGTYNTVTFTTPNIKSVKDGASSCIIDHVIPLMYIKCCDGWSATRTKCQLALDTYCSRSNPIGGFRYKTPKLTSPAWGKLGGSPTTPLQNNAPNLSISSKALKNVPQYPWKNPFLQNVQTATTAKKSPPRHAQNINIQQQPLYNPFQNYTAGLWNTQQLAVHSPLPKHLKASDYNLPSSCDVIAKSDLEDICNSMQMPTILGSGSFGEVRLMRQLSSRRVCAVKVHHKNRDEKSIIKDLQKETSMLTSLSHLDCIPKLFGISRIGSNTDVPVLVQEFVGDPVTFKSTTVADVIDAKGLNGPSSFSVAIQVCRAIKEIHFSGMIHCDLKTDNIMFLRGPSGKMETSRSKLLTLGKQ
ncbi:protein kinase [Apostichopus japonicus]|uniref:mitogen-activated protein kinase kinase n=1 Tax=Stichopus japonicus TaxID=307972 RepID=A0A2G8KRA6_STIJA|nr:protein kinase [Apostichopus japonicus]